MPTITCTRRLEWDALHRIPGHEGKCRAFHGHRYAAEITCLAESLDNLGRVIDFGEIKLRVGGFIDKSWDHTAILWRGDDSDAAKAIAAFNEAAGRPIYWMDVPPTAENLAAELARIAQELLAPCGISVVSVRLYETPNGYADCIL